MKKATATLLIMLSVYTISAQNTPGILSKSETDSLITSYCRVLNDTYFNKTLSKEITATLTKKLKAGEFYNVTQLTDRLSLLLRDITKDLHFYIGVNQPPAVIDKSTENISTPEPENKNGGFSQVSMIAHNIGYIKWDAFIADDEAFQKAIAALQLVQGCKYLIFDLSGCGGGDGRAGGFVDAHLFENNEYQHLLQKRCSGEKDWHQSEVPYNYTNGPRLYHVPVYVIVSKNTASAAEYFALTIKETKRGIVLGDTTAGAGNPSVMVNFGNYFAIIPVCEIQTNSGVSIEGKGVVPNVILTTDDWLKETIEYIGKHH